MFKLGVNCFLLAMFLFSLTSQPVWALPPEIEADRFLLAAMNKMDAKDYAGAITYFDKIIALKVPLPDDLYYNYGKVLGQTGDHNGAYKQYEIYLTKAGRGGKYYMEALQGLTDAEQSIDKARERAREQARIAAEKARKQAEAVKIKARWAATEHIVAGDTLKKKGKCKEAIVSYNKALKIEVYADVLDKRGQCYTHYSLKPKEYGKAILDFTKAITIDPDNASYYFNRGKAHHNSKDYTKAAEDFSEAIKRDSGDASIYKWRGWSWKALKKYDKAVADFTKVIELQLKENVHYIYGYRAECWEGKGDLDKAMADRNMAITKYTGKYASTKARLYKDRGDLWGKKKDFDKAITDFTTAIELDSDSTSALIARANLLQDKKNELDKAIEDYTRALEISPTHSITYFNRGLAWWKKKDWDKAITDFTESIKHDPKYFRAYFFRARCRSSQKEWAKAIDDFSQAITLDAKHYRAHIYRGLARLKLENLDEALADFSKAVGLDPKQTWAYEERGDLLLDKGEVDLALADFYKIIEISSSSPTYKLGSAVRKLERNEAYDVAIALWTRLIEKWPSQRNYHRRASTREKADDRRGALDDYSQAIAADPDEYSGYTRRARCFRQLAEPAKALADYDQALKVVGDSDSPLSALKGKATLLLDMGRNEEAQEAYKLALLEYGREISNSKNEYLDNTFSQRAYLRTSFDDYRGAVADLTSAIEISLGKYYYKRRADILWARLGEYDRAQGDFAKLLEMDPDYDSALAGSGIVLYRQGKYRKARKALRNAVALKPESAEINNALAFFYATCPKKRYRDPVKAVEHAKIAVEGFSTPYYYENLAFAYAAGEQFAEAAEAQKEAIKLYKKRTPWNINDQQRRLEKMKERLASYQAGLVWEGEGHPLEWRL